MADDHLTFRKAIISLLDKHYVSSDYQVSVMCEVENGKELLETLKTTMPDVILLDIEMPVMNGKETLTIVKNLYPELKVIMFSQYDNPLLVQDFLYNGASAYIDKGCELEKIAETINEVYFEKLTNTGKIENELKFTKKEKELISLICIGKQNKEMADLLHISIKTIETHKKNMFNKIGVKNSIEFINYINKGGLNYLS